MHHFLHRRRYLLMSLFAILSTLFSPFKPMALGPVEASSGLRLYVKPGEMGDCSSWASACKLTTALQSAIPGSEIWVARGVYKPTADTGDRNASFQLKDDIAIYGGFGGTEETLEQRNIVANPTVLSGDIDTNDKVDATGVVTTTDAIVGANSYHVVTSNGVTTTAILDGFTITSGDAISGDNPGGGMRNENAAPTLTNLILVGNRGVSGAGMYNVNSNPILSNAVFRSNTASAYGGGMYNVSNSRPILSNVTFDSNSAPNGGGIANNNGHPLLTNVSFFSNSSSTAGGGMSNQSSTPRLNNVTFAGNETTGHGAGLFNGGSNSLLYNVTFAGNRAAGNGGGVYNTSSHPSLINVVFSNNSATNGGGMQNTSSSPKITNTTFSNNIATTGGGIRNSTGSKPILVNTILWGNQANTAPQILNSSSTCTLQYSLVAGGCPSGCTCDAHLLTSAPRFVDAANADLHLRSDSPAIDAGDNLAEPLNAIHTDRDGNLRFRDVPNIPDTGNGTAPVIDMGAYEYDPTQPTATSLQVSPNPALHGQAITLMATVSATSGPPGGNVTFYDGTVVLASRELADNGSATLITSTLAIGTHTITAQYNGDGIFLPSTSSAVSLAIQPYYSYLPLALKNYIDYFDGSSELEPNDTYQQANGPLRFGQKYGAQPNDAKDYFSFYLPTAGKLSIEMSGHSANGVQMLLYYGTPIANGEILRVYDKPYIAEYDGAAGWYYLYIYATSGYHDDQPYTIEVNAPVSAFARP